MNEQQRTSEDQFSRLVNPSKLDAERWKPMVYAADIDVPVGANGIGRGHIQINEQALFVTRASCLILGNTMDPETSGLYQDGQYLILMRDEVWHYSNVPVHADLLWGPKIEGSFRNFEYPLYYSASHAIYFEITNLYTRILTPEAPTFRIQIALSGLADYGMVQSRR
jgi:hypothetical protein